MVESEDLNTFVAENREDGKRCLGVYEVRLQIRKWQNPWKEYEFFVNSSWTEIKYRGSKRTIKHPDHIDLRIPDDISSALFFDNKMRLFSVRLAIVEARKVSKKRRLNDVGSKSSTDVSPTKKKKKVESPKEYERQLSAQFQKVPRTQVIPTLHAKRGDDVLQKTELKVREKVVDVGPDSDSATQSKKECSDVIKGNNNLNDTNKGQSAVLETEEAKSSSEVAKPKVANIKEESSSITGKTSQLKKSKRNRDKNKRKRGQEKSNRHKNKKKKKDGNLDETENKYSKELALVDTLVSEMEKTSKAKQKKVKKKLDAIEAFINTKHAKKRGKIKKKEKLKKVCIEGVRRDMRQKKLESREKYKKKKTPGVKFA